ncbi:hypothetical protein VSR68_27345 [Paraburkholderia phymatum]
MTENEVDFIPLRVTGVTAAGKRKLDAEGKRKLIDACLQSRASIAGLALKAGMNANQLPYVASSATSSPGTSRDDSRCRQGVTVRSIALSQRFADPF